MFGPAPNPPAPPKGPFQGCFRLETIGKFFRRMPPWSNGQTSTTVLERLAAGVALLTRVLLILGNPPACEPLVAGLAFRHPAQVVPGNPPAIGLLATGLVVWAPL